VNNSRFWCFIPRKEPHASGVPRFPPPTRVGAWVEGGVDPSHRYRRRTQARQVCPFRVVCRTWAHHESEPVKRSR